jgi:colanic acid biosynthesis glycosyl transferase WcaI
MLMIGFDRVSTISSKMLEGLENKGVVKVVLFQNWVDIDLISFMPTSHFRQGLNIMSGTVVALYSGNMGEKQGLDLVIEAARLLEDDENILFVLCGDGVAKDRLQNLATNLRNVKWIPLQPLEDLNELLNLADIHLLPQRSDVADLVMPSKLTGMLASGRPVITNAHADTKTASVVKICGLLVEPGNKIKFAAAIKTLAQDANLRLKLGKSGREYAEKNWAREVVLRRFDKSISELIELNG